MSASAKRREITPQLFAAWGRTQQHTVVTCPTRPRVVFDSVVQRRQHFKLSSGQQFVDRISLVLVEDLVSDIFTVLRKTNKTLFKNRLRVFSFGDACK